MNSPPVALIDSCIFFSATMRNILMWLAYEDVFICRWTTAIEKEWTHNLSIKRPEISLDKIHATQQKMRDTVLGWEVQDYSVKGIQLRDPGDIHVLAAAIHCNADFLVTENISDFVGSTDQGFRGRVVTLDEFIANLYASHSPLLVREVITNIPKSFKRKSVSLDEWIEMLQRHNLLRTASILKGEL